MEKQRNTKKNRPRCYAGRVIQEIAPGKSYSIRPLNGYFINEKHAPAYFRATKPTTSRNASHHHEGRRIPYSYPVRALVANLFTVADKSTDTPAATGTKSIKTCSTCRHFNAGSQTCSWSTGNVVHVTPQTSCLLWKGVSHG